VRIVERSKHNEIILITEHSLTYFMLCVYAWGLLKELTCNLIKFHVFFLLSLWVCTEHNNWIILKIVNVWKNVKLHNHHNNNGNDKRRQWKYAGHTHTKKSFSSSHYYLFYFISLFVWLLTTCRCRWAEGFHIIKFYCFHCEWWVCMTRNDSDFCSLCRYKIQRHDRHVFCLTVIYGP
jgi:hypothetical protein